MDIKKFAFEVSKTDGYAREGVIKTHRGDIHTPAFMPVGTQATVKACTINDIKKTHSEIILCNTYHLMIRPGVERIERVGGLHKFMNCDLPILTDSGGFQVMSLSKLNKIDREKGAIFNSHIDGKKFILSPERSIEIQLGLNSDICMIMDECPKNTKDYDLINNSMNLSLYWAERSKKAFGLNPHKALFGIIQGGLFKDLRIKSLKFLSDFLYFFLGLFLHSRLWSWMPKTASRSTEPRSNWCVSSFALSTMPPRASSSRNQPRKPSPILLRRSYSSASIFTLR